MGKKKVAIACQGGGTHAAFTWGVLTQILRTKKTWDASPDEGELRHRRRQRHLGRRALCVGDVVRPCREHRRCGVRHDRQGDRTPGLSLDHLRRDDPGRDRPQSAGRLPLAVEVEGRAVSGVQSLRRFRQPRPGRSVDDGCAAGVPGISGAPPLLCPHFETIDWPRVAKADLRILVGAIEVLSGNFEVFDSDKSLEKWGCSPTDPRSISTMPPAGGCAARSRSRASRRRGPCPRFCRHK